VAGTAGGQLVSQEGMGFVDEFEEGLMIATKGGVEDDADVRAALLWFARTSGDSNAFTARLKLAQQAYREATASLERLGQDPELCDLGADVVASYFAQAKSLLDDRRTYDLVLASRIIPWVKQVGANVVKLEEVSGASDRVSRMLHDSGTDPEGAMLELVVAGNYAADGFGVEFVAEEPGQAKTPDMKLVVAELNVPVPVECKRIRRGQYEQKERDRHRKLFRKVASIIDGRRLSVHIDVTYTRELHYVPEDYLAKWLEHALVSPIVTLQGYPWQDESGRGAIYTANIAAVRDDIRSSSLMFGPKMARLLSGAPVRENGYHLVAGADPDRRDPRFIESVSYASVITWQCIAPEAIEKKARHVTKRLAEADQQMLGSDPGIVHMAMDAELQCQSSDLRRERNRDAIAGFTFKSTIKGLFVHYLVPRITEFHSWLVDETVDRFGPGYAQLPEVKLFQRSTPVDNDLSAWQQPAPRA
jgi:hypothetical protein